MFYYLIVLFLVLLAIGFFNTKKKYNDLLDQDQLMVEFLNKLKSYVESGDTGSNSYTWLLENSYKVQSTLGEYGIAGSYKPPFANYMYKNYPIILNVLPELRQTIDRRSRTSYENYRTLHDTVVKYRGALQETIKSVKKELRNPIVWFFNGIQFLLYIPLQLLMWSGLLSSNLVSRIENSIFFKLFSFIVGTAGFISSIITIVAEWENIIYFITSLFQS